MNAPRPIHPRRHARTFGAQMLRLVLAATTVVITGCWSGFSQPGVEIYSEPAYNQQEILIPFYATGDRNPAQVQWTLNRFEPGPAEWNPIGTRETQTPNGYGGILSLGYLDEGRYRIRADVVTTRDGSYVPVPYLGEPREFYVDRTATSFAVRIDVPDLVTEDESGTPIAPPLSATQSIYLRINAISAPNRDFESNERLLRVRAVSGDPNQPVRPPVQGRDEFDAARVRLWGANELTAGTTVTIIMVIVDDAGNRSDTWVGNYLAE